MGRGGEGGKSALSLIFNVEEGREEEERREKTWFTFTSTQEYTECTGVCKISQEYARVYRNIQELTEFTGICKFSEICKS